MVEYAIVSSDSLVGLENKVNDAATRGWIPQGGVTFVGTDFRTQPFCQALTRKREPKAVQGSVPK